MYLILATIVFVWFFIIFLDTIFKSCMLYPYIRALYTAGLEIKPFSIYWRITRYNRYINRMGLYRTKFLKIWFQVGAVVTSAIFFPCISLYVFKLMGLLHTGSSEEFESSKIVPVIPGYNFPLSYWKLYGCVLFVSSLIHEFGHALAASRLGISVDSFGFALILFAPVAFVNLRLDQFRHSSKWEKLSVFCAGIWHNIVLSLLCLLTLNYFNLLVSPLYNIGGGVQVLRVNEDCLGRVVLPFHYPPLKKEINKKLNYDDLSALNHHITGLAPGEQIYALCNCAVKDFDSWKACLQEMEEKPRGLCVPKHLLYNNSANEEIEKKIRARRLVNLEDLTEVVPIEQCIERTDQLYFDVEMKKYQVGVCLHARTAVQSYKICTEHSECNQRTLCGLPHLPESHRFIIIERGEKPPVLYVGSVNELYIDGLRHTYLEILRHGEVFYKTSLATTTVKVSEFLPKWKFLSSNIPEAIKEFLQYVLIFSNGLACLNVLPIASLDGKFISENLIHILLCNFISYERRKLVIKFISIFTLSVVFALIVVSSYKMFVLHLM